MLNAPVGDLIKLLGIILRELSEALLRYMTLETGPYGLLRTLGIPYFPREVLESATQLLAFLLHGNDVLMSRHCTQTLCSLC